MEVRDPSPQLTPGEIAVAPAPRSLNVAIIGWARLGAQAWEGSGYNLNASELARGLAMRGHRVSYLQSGMAFSWGFTGPGSPRIRLREHWGPGIRRPEQSNKLAEPMLTSTSGGIACFELVNSPNLSPAAWNFGNLAHELADPASSELVVSWLREQHADVVHLHSQEGLALDLIPTIRRAGFPVIATLHNYWFLCPQVDLLHAEQSVCIDYDGGRRCETCLKHQPVAKLRRAKAMGDSLESLLGLYPADVVRKAIYGAASLSKRLLGKPDPDANKRRRERERRSRPPHPDVHPDPELWSGWNERATPPASAGSLPPLEEWELPKDYARAPFDANERVLEARTHDSTASHHPGTSNGTPASNKNQPAPSPATTVHLRVLNDFGKRRLAGVEALKSASLVTAPSDCLRRVHVAMGVPEAQTRRVLLGQPHFDQIHRAAQRSPYYHTRPWSPDMADRTPLRFGFLGTTRPNKGLEVLTRAIPLIPEHVRQRIRITIHAAGFDSGFRKRLSIYPEVSVFGGYDTFQLVSMLAPGGGGGGGAGGYDVAILPHIWLENSPLVLLENLHAGKFVISSRLGGPVDWIREPGRRDPASSPTVREGASLLQDAGLLGNGLLFPGGDETALAACMLACFHGHTADGRPVVIPSPHEVHSVSGDLLQTYPGHVREVESIYAEVLANQPAPSAVGNPHAAAVTR